MWILFDSGRLAQPKYIVLLFRDHASRTKMIICCVLIITSTFGYIVQSHIKYIVWFLLSLGMFYQILSFGELNRTFSHLKNERFESLSLIIIFLHQNTIQLPHIAEENINIYEPEYYDKTDAEVSIVMFRLLNIHIHRSYISVFPFDSVT